MTALQDQLGVRSLRAVALSSALVVIGSFVGVLYHVVNVISDPTAFLVLVALAFVAGTVLARYLPVEHAVALATVLLVGGLVWYLQMVGSISLWLWPHLRYTLALVTGQSVLSIVHLESWVLAVTPAPVFLTWYLAVRRRYVGSAIVGGSTTLFFVLTGDAGPQLALLGVVGTAALVGAGDLDRVDAALGDADVVATVVALAILLSATVTVVPAGLGYTFSADTGLQGPGGFGSGERASTIEGNLLSVDDRLPILGSLSLSSTVRYRVNATSQEYWRVGAYDVYTGDGWIRRGNTGPVDRRLGTPPGRNRTVEQRYRVLTPTSAMPAAWRPSSLSGPAADDARVTFLGGLQPTAPLAANETYRVESAVPVATLSELRTAGRDYPAGIADRYLQLPDSTPERVAERTDRLTANADSPYETARVIEYWLEENREYSLNVSAPSGPVADSFLFEMDRGYCTYYATTMVTMLRTQDIPARFVVGYTPGQRVGPNEWVVRGHDAHAWVEVYFPDVGWVRFDPTPAGPRQAAERADLRRARENNVSRVDTNDSRSGEWTPTPTPTPTPEDDGVRTAEARRGQPTVQGETAPLDRTLTPAESDVTVPEPAAGGDDSDGGLALLPTARGGTLGLLAVIGIAAMARRTGLARRGYRALWLRWQPRRDPERDVERAFERLSALLARRHRERRPGETVRAYLAAIEADDRARRVAAIRERLRYADSVDEPAATEAVSLVDDLVRE